MDDYQQYMEEADHLADKGDVEGAIRTYNSAIEKYPQQVGGHYSLAVLYHSQDRTGQAIDSFQKAAKLDPDEASIFNNLGVLHYTEGLLEEAEANFRKAVEIEPCYADALYGLGKIYQQHAASDDSQKLEQYIANVENRIQTLYERGRIEEAWEVSKTVIKLLPDDAERQNDHAVLCYELDKLDEARKAIDRARELAPQETDVQENYRMIHAGSPAYRE